MTHTADIEKITLIVKRLCNGKTENLRSDMRLVEDVGLDSLMLMNLIEEVQQEFTVTFLPEDYSFESFSTIQAIAQLVTERRAVREPRHSF